MPSNNPPPIPSTMSTTTSTFDIVSHYRKLITDDSDTNDDTITPPIAAIESLIAQLMSDQPATISETLSLLQNASDLLHKSTSNSISISAGTDLFQRYVVTTLQGRGPAGGDFALLRRHLINNSRLFVARAKEARFKIAENALPLVVPTTPQQQQHNFPPSARSKAGTTTTVLTYGPSRVVHSILQHAASKSALPNLKVIYITPSATTSSSTTLLTKQLSRQISSLRHLDIPAAVIPFHAAAYAISSISTTTATNTPTKLLILVGASSVLSNGGILSHMGTYQLALLAKTLGHKFYVACESYKIVRMHPLSQTDLPIKQDVVNFDAGKGGEAEGADNGTSEDSGEPGLIDMTPPELITSIVTENGIMTPGAVSEEAIKLWF